VTARDPAEELYARADALDDTGAHADAFALFRQLAEQGHVEAMSRVALMYEIASGTPYDREQSIAWDMRAIAAGSELSRFNLAITYRRQGNIREAKRWFEDALVHGDGEAALELAKLYTVSDLERQTVARYLDLALNSDSLTPQSREEAEELRREYDQVPSHS
jgi:TPR repeat protein